MADKSSAGQDGWISIRILSLRKIWTEDESCKETGSFLRNSCSVGNLAKTGSPSFTETESTFFNDELDPDDILVVFPNTYSAKSE